MSIPAKDRIDAEGGLRLPDNAGIRKIATSDASGDFSWGAAPPFVNVKDFGAVGDGVHDDAPAIQAAIESFSDGGPPEDRYQWAGGTVYIPAGLYRLGSTININRAGTILRGVGRGRFQQAQEGITHLVADDGVTAIRTIYPWEGNPIEGRGDWSVIQDLELSGSSISWGEDPTGPVADAIDMEFKCTIHNVHIWGFTGNGITISDGAGNANQFHINNVRIEWCRGHGIWCNGGDSNAGIGIQIDVSYNRRKGIADSSFLGNWWFGCHATDQGQPFAQCTLTNGSNVLTNVTGYGGNWETKDPFGPNGFQIGEDIYSYGGGEIGSFFPQGALVTGIDAEANTITLDTNAMGNLDNCPLRLNGLDYWTDPSGNFNYSLFVGMYMESSTFGVEINQPAMWISPMGESNPGTGTYLGSGVWSGATVPLGPDDGAAIAERNMPAFQIGQSPRMAFKATAPGIAGGDVNFYWDDTDKAWKIAGDYSTPGSWAAIQWNSADHPLYPYVGPLFGHGLSIGESNVPIKLGHLPDAPGAGTHREGDIKFNRTPALGEAAYWVCTEAGTPGTWMRVGTIGHQQSMGAVTWDPGSIANGSYESKDFQVLYGSPGDAVAVGFSVPLPPGMQLTAAFYDTNQVRATLANHSGSPQDLGSGTLTAVAWRVHV